MKDKRLLTIQDISCVGQCSLTVALPILSACGLETSILPSAVLSTHTAGFSGYTFRDLCDDMPKINAHWQKENLKFEAIYTGYLGSVKQIDYVLDIVEGTLSESGTFFVDPAFADNGKLYPGFDEEYVAAMSRLSKAANYIIPNITEACFLTGVDFKTAYDSQYIKEIVTKLKELGCNNIILTGVSYKEGRTGILVVEGENEQYYEHEFLPNSCHGTGDIYASAFVGSMMRGKSAYESAKIAADYTVDCIKATQTETNHWYGAKFEPVLENLINYLK